MHLFSSSCPSLIFWFSWAFYLGLPSPAGCWFGVSDWFSPRYTVRVERLTSLTYRRYFRDAIKLCQPDAIHYGKGFGMLWHMKIATMLDDVIHSRLMSHMSHQGRETWGRVFTQKALENIGRTQVVSHLQQIAGLEREACTYLMSRLPAIQAASAVYNVTIKFSNETIAISFGPSNTSLTVAEHLWLVSMQSSVFSSVAAAFALWVVMLLRLPRSVFGFLSTRRVRRT
uniref:Minor structural glycoprotein n=1 Tax=Lactate dehydrogenase-elevating virus TaxID=11048 RepID=Q9YS36_LDV|nr:minor structural glycoprotein [Lactate dehydrogenase-elevating virus]